MYYLIFIVLAFIAYQLYRYNQLKTAEILQREQNKKQSEEDELLKQQFPNLFLESRQEIREYAQGINRKSDYYKRYGKYFSFDPDNFGEQVMWDDISDGLEKSNEDKELVPDNNTREKNKKHLGKLLALSHEFFKNGQAKSNLTNAELNYILFEAWKDIADNFQGEIVVIGFEFQLNSYLERHKKGQ